DLASTRRTARGHSAPSSTPRRLLQRPAMRSARPRAADLRPLPLPARRPSRVLPGHDDEPVGDLLIGGDQREAKADVGLSAEIRGSWHGGTPPGFFLQRPSRGTVPDERRWPFLRGLPVSVVLRGPTSSGRAAMGNARDKRQGEIQGSMMARWLDTVIV